MISGVALAANCQQLPRKTGKGWQQLAFQILPMESASYSG